MLATGSADIPHAASRGYTAPPGIDRSAAPAPMIRDYLLKSNIPAKTADSAIKTLINQKEIVESNGKIILLNG